MKHTLADLQQALNVLEFFGLMSNVRGKPAQDREDIIKKLNGKTPRAARSVMTSEKVDLVWDLHKQELTQKAIAKEVGVHVSTVGRVLRNETT